MMNAIVVPLVASLWLGPGSTDPQQGVQPGMTGGQTAERPLPPMSTDRPDITDSTDVVGREYWQIETGVSLQSHLDHGMSHRELMLPQAMLRLGLSDRIELRIGGDGLVTDSTAGPERATGRVRVTGASDVEVGAKWKLFERPRRGFLFALEPVLSFPTAVTASRAAATTRRSRSSSIATSQRGLRCPPTSSCRR